MCLLVFSWQPGAAETLVLAGNRDEFHERPAAPAGWWRNGTLGGRDLRAGGTWLAAHASGRFAVVTNFREAIEEGRGPRSRGELVTRYLDASEGPMAFAAELAGRGNAYAGFNLLLGDPGELVYVSNRGRGPERLSAGLYGLSNHLLDTPWPKLKRTRERFARLLAPATRAGAGAGAGAAAAAGQETDTGALLKMLADRTPTCDDELPDTGIGVERERLLSSPFIVSPWYGTRCSTVLKILQENVMEFTERRFDPTGAACGESQFRFRHSGGVS
ncbi:NRDE family protein [Wenzhouxiangella sp. XN24]|uniref:NRDE family protein n=1 Tax=Wenzhouxiangella sp. XN24 TaxID=2713569 RepID=UPI0013EB554C|nr:NRDE family protein [Wenzhouxiangella sp. XN24]NGX17299.1 NRDE family protein [Wenzhouxiangella sp. XN24]